MVESAEGFLEGFERRIARRPRRALQRPARAAVLIPLVGDEGSWRLILTRRTHTVATHKGQVAFPGGFAEGLDRDAVDTALREASEEVGIERAEVRVLGRLDDFPTHDDAVAVTPVVGRVQGFPTLTPEASEVARIFDIPVAALQLAERWRVRYGTRHGRRYPIYYFDHDGETLWGLSAYIVMLFLSLTSTGSPLPVPEFDTGAGPWST